MTSILSYTSRTPGKARLLVSLIPSIPLDVTVLDDPDGLPYLELIGTDGANVVYVGAAGLPGIDLMLRAVHRDRSESEIFIQGVPDTPDEVSRGRRKGAYVHLPRGSHLAVADSGPITVKHRGFTLSIGEAARRGLLTVEI